MKKQVLTFIILIITNILLGQENGDIYRMGSSSTFVKEPYLIFEGVNTQMKIVWQLDNTGVCGIYWGMDTNYSLGSNNTNEYGSDHQHSYTITGLTPDTRYFYKVSAGSSVHQASFRTAPYDDAANVRFFILGDTRTQYYVHDALSESIINDYTADSTLQTLTICSGDLVTYGAAEPSWQNEFFSDLAPHVQQRLSEVPFVSCLGNHGIYQINYSGVDLTTAIFGKYLPYPYVARRYWSFDYGPVHITVIDQYPGNYNYSGQGLISSDDLEWIEDDLNNTSKSWKIVVFHEPGYSAGGSSSGYPHPNNDNVRDLLQPLLEQYGVQLVLAGHNHYYAKAAKNGIYHLTVAGGGAPLYSPDPGHKNVMKTDEIYHYGHVDVSGSSMLVNILTINGDTIDALTIPQFDRPSHLLGYLSQDTLINPIEEATIEVAGQVTHPDSLGYYGMELDPGTYDVTITLDGYYAVQETVEIYDGTETQLDTTLQQLVASLDDLPSTHLNWRCKPNPFSDNLRVSIELEKADIVNISLFHPSGILIRTLYHGYLQAGKHDFSFNTTSLTPGIYFIRFSNGKSEETRKILCAE